MAHFGRGDGALMHYTESDGPPRTHRLRVQGSLRAKNAGLSSSALHLFLLYFGQIGRDNSCLQFSMRLGIPVFPPIT